MSIRPWLIILAAAVLFSAGWLVNGWRYSAKLAGVEAAHAQLLEQQANAVAESVQAARELEQRRVTTVEEQRDIAQQQNETLAADVAAGRTVSDRLRAELNALRARYASRDSTAADGSQGQQSADPIGVLIGVLEGLDSAGREVAEYADRLRIAGLACERSYDHVRAER